LEIINLYAAWGGILAGFLIGAIVGMFFAKEDWLGGYSSWTRRLLRLAHISCFGIAFINFSFVFTVQYLGLKEGLFMPSRLFVVAAITMPIICFASAFKKPCRHLFFIPALSLIVGTALFILQFGGN